MTGGKKKPKAKDPFEGFDVDAAMKAEGISIDPPEEFDVDAAMRAEGIEIPKPAAPAPEPKPEGFLERLSRGAQKYLDWTGPRATSFLTGATSAASLGFGSPEVELASARKRLEQQRTMGTHPVVLEQTENDIRMLESRIADKTAHGGYNVAGEVAGSLVGPGGLAAKGVSKAVGVGKNLGGQLLRSGTAGAVGGAVEGGGRELVETGDTDKALEAGGKGALVGAAVPAAAKVIAGTLGRGAALLAKTKGGQARDLVDRYQADLRGLKPTDDLIGTEARKSATNVVKGLDDRFDRDVMQPHVAEKARITAGPGSELAPPDEVAAIYEEMRRLARSGKLTPGERSVLGGEGGTGGLMDDLVAGFDEKGAPLFKPLTHEQVNDLRSMYGRVAKTGQQGQGVAPAAMEGVRRAAKDVVDAGPYRETNERFAAGKTRYEQDRNRLALPKRAPVNPRIATEEGVSEEEVAKVANALARQPQNTVTKGVRNYGRYADFVEENPEFRRDIEFPQAIAAKGDLEFRLPGTAQSHGGLISRLPPAASIPAFIGMAAYDKRLALGAALSDAIAANATPIAGRVLYPLARGGAALAEDSARAAARAPAVVALSRGAKALQEERRREEERKRR